MSILTNATLVSPGNPFYAANAPVAPSGVTSIVAGANINILPLSGVGAVTISAAAPVSGFFRGMILPYLGTTAPSADWCLCDGNPANPPGVPNLTNMFLLGTSVTHPFGSTGGAESVALTVNMLPDHTHGGTGLGTDSGTKTSGFSFTNGSSSTTGINSAGYTPGTNVPTLPPYYTLNYIMKL